MYLYLKLIILCRYYRQHCTLDFGSYTKDLSAICADLSSVFILDNSPGAYRAYPGEAIFVPLVLTCAVSPLPPGLGDVLMLCFSRMRMIISTLFSNL